MSRFNDCSLGNREQRPSSARKRSTRNCRCCRPGVRVGRGLQCRPRNNAQAAAKEATHLARKIALTEMMLRPAEPGCASCRISTARASPPEKSPAVSCG
jgi:hypothetical protein